jgi:hypothetical protein
LRNSFFLKSAHMLVFFDMELFLIQYMEILILIKQSFGPSVSRDLSLESRFIGICHCSGNSPGKLDLLLSKKQGWNQLFVNQKVLIKWCKKREENNEIQRKLKREMDSTQSCIYAAIDLTIQSDRLVYILKRILLQIQWSWYVDDSISATTDLMKLKCILLKNWRYECMIVFYFRLVFEILMGLIN